MRPSPSRLVQVDAVAGRPPIPGQPPTKLEFLARGQIDAKVEATGQASFRHCHSWEFFR